MNLKKDWSSIRRQLLIVFLDIVSISAVALLSLVIRFDFVVSSIPVHFLTILWQTYLLILSVKIISFSVFNLYKSIWQFAGINELLQIVAAAFLAEALILTLNLIFRTMLPASFYLIDWILTMVAVGVVRFWFRIYAKLSLGMHCPAKKMERVMLIGAGKMGTMMIDELANEKYRFGKAAIFADDDPAKKNKQIKGVRIAGTCDEIPALAKRFRIDTIIFCIPSASNEDRKRILTIALNSGCPVKIAQVDS